MANTSLGQDPQPYGNAAHPVRQDPTQYIIEVHWPVPEGFTIQFNYEWVVPPGPLSPTSPNSSLDNFSGTPLNVSLPLLVPTRGTWAAALDLQCNAPMGTIDAYADLLVNGVVVLTVGPVDKAFETAVSGFTATTSGPVPIMGPAASFAVDVQVRGSAGGAGGNIVGMGFSHLTVSWLP